MPALILEDRVLARVAFQAVGRSEPADPDQGAEVAIRHALRALLMLGAVVTPWTVRAVRDDIASIFADAAKMTQARALAVQTMAETPGRQAA